MREATKVKYHFFELKPVLFYWNQCCVWSPLLHY